MKREIIIPFDGDSSRESRDNLIKALEEQLRKYEADGGKDNVKSAGFNPTGREPTREIRDV